MKRMHKGSKRAAFYNEGPLVFLYDGSNATQIRESGVEVLEGYGESSADDPALTKLAARGVLLLYELFQDDEVEIEVIMAEKITPEERSRLSAHVRLPTGWIRLPTGKLFLDSYNTLRARREEITDQGATVSLPAGDYSVTVYQCDNVAAEESNHPHDVLVLRPLKRKPTARRPAILRDTATAPPPVDDGVGYGKITDGVFDGLIRFITGTNLFAVNMDPRTAEDLGLQVGDEISFEIANGELNIPGIYLGETMNEYRDALPIVEEREKSAVELARVSWGGREDFDGILLICERTKRQASVPEAFFGRWISVHVR
jgi:hypothetical protein